MAAMQVLLLIYTCLFTFHLIIYVLPNLLPTIGTGSTLQDTNAESRVPFANYGNPVVALVGFLLLYLSKINVHILKLYMQL